MAIFKGWKRIVVIPALALLLALTVVAGFRNPGMVRGIADYLAGSSSPTVAQIPSFTDPAYASPVALDIIVDTPPDENTHIARLVLSSLASAIDQRCHENAGEVIVYAHYFTSRSYLSDALSFVVPSIAKFPPAPIHQHSDNAYTQSQDDLAYTTAYSSWQDTITMLRGQVSATCATVHSHTQALAALPLPYDDKGADLYGALLESSSHFHNITGMKKLLVIISSLVNTTTQQSTGPFTIPGVEAMFLGRTCIQATPAQCEQTASFWKNFLRKVGVTSITDVEPSQVSLALQGAI